MSIDAPASAPVLELGPEPGSTREWVRAVVRHREVLVAMAGKDFKVRYKRATFGVLWAVALPMLQAAVMIVVFGRVARFDEGGLDYTGYVLAGMIAWGYVGSTIPSAATAIVDGASLTDKVWFPRALLVLSPVLANLIGLGISLGLITMFQLVRQGLDVDVLLVVPGTVLLVALVSGTCLTAAALQVEFRDIRFIVQAGLMVLFYATPILYPPDALGDLAEVARLANPFVGVVELFQASLTDTTVHGAAVLASLAWTTVLLLLAVRLHRRDDRLFVDLL
jgi:lipopolysaccharide transport system permease protein